MAVHRSDHGGWVRYRDEEEMLGNVIKLQFERNFIDEAHREEELFHLDVWGGVLVRDPDRDEPGQQTA